MSMSTNPSVWTVSPAGTPSTFLTFVPSLVEPVQTLIFDVELSVDLMLKKADPELSVECSDWSREFPALDEAKCPLVLPADAAAEESDLDSWDVASACILGL